VHPIRRKRHITYILPTHDGKNNNTPILFIIREMDVLNNTSGGIERN
jgi:hypothetical protein